MCTTLEAAEKIAELTGDSISVDMRFQLLKCDLGLENISDGAFALLIFALFIIIVIVISMIIKCICC